jgi:urea ABC transporter ATP-binding protein UrtE
VLLNVNGISSGYGEIVILTDLTLHLHAREVVAVLGRNGIGKTTLMKTLAGLLKTRQGSITFDGGNITHVPPSSRARLGIGYVPQGREIFPKLTVLENLLVGVYAGGFPRSLVDEVLEDFPVLRPKLKNLGGSLSGGQQQLLALARAIVIRPTLLLLDEPSEGIQPSILDEIHDVLIRAKERHGLSILLVEQNLDFAGALADRAYLMDTGRISREVNPGRLLDDPALLQEFIGSGTL